MKIKDLKELLKKPDGISMDDWNEMQVLIPVSGEFDGFFHSPCIEESGVVDLGIDEDTDETDASFIIVPCGFFNEHTGVPPELN